MKKIALIQTWLGPLPNYFKEHIITCSQQEKIDFFIFTDQVVNDVSYPNIFINPITKEEVENKISNCLNKDVKIFSPYHTNNLKASYGDLYKEYVKDYDYVGCYDIDTLMGDLYNWVLPYLGEFDVISTGGKNYHNRISGPFLIWKNTKTLNTFYKLFNNPSLEVTLSNPSFYAFEEGEFAKRVMDEYKVKIIYNSTNLSEDDGKVIFDAVWDNGKTYCNGVEIMFYHFINKNHTTFHRIGNKISAMYKKNTINDFYWVTYFSESYSNIVINLIKSIFKYSNRKCILYSVNFDYQLPNEFAHNGQFIIKRIDIEEGNIDSRGRDENILSCKPKILSNVIDLFPKGKFVYIDTDCYITANADGVDGYFKELENYPLINSHMHDRIYNRGLIVGEEWTSSVDILAKKMGVEICIFPRRKANLIVFDGNSKWYWEECGEIYYQYKNTEEGIFALHDEDIINAMLSKYKMDKCLPICDVERTNQISIEESIENSDFFTPNISQNIKLPKHTNDIITFHLLKTQEEFDGVKNNYGNSVVDCEEVLVTYNNNTIFFTKNSFLTNKIIDENVDFVVKNLEGDIITRLNNQNLFHYSTFYISNFNLNGGLYVVEIVKTNNREKIYNNLLQI